MKPFPSMRRARRVLVPLSLGVLLFDAGGHLAGMIMAAVGIVAIWEGEA